MPISSKQPLDYILKAVRVGAHYILTTFLLMLTIISNTALELSTIVLTFMDN